MSWDIFLEKERSDNIDEFYAKLKKNNILGWKKKTPFLLTPAFWSERKNAKPFMLTHGWTFRWGIQNWVSLSHGKLSECPGFLQMEIHMANAFAAHASVSLSFLSLTHVLSFEEVNSVIYMLLYTKLRLLMLQTQTIHAHAHTLHHCKRVPIRPKGASNSHGNKVMDSCRTGV